MDQPGTPAAPPPPAAPAAPAPTSADGWPALLGDSERPDPNVKLAPALVTTPRGLPPAAAAPASPAGPPGDAGAQDGPEGGDESEADAGAEIPVKAHTRRVPNAVQERINQALQKQRLAEQRAEAAEQQLQALRGGPPDPRQAQAPPGVDPDRPRPTADQFQTMDDYLDALTDWKADRTAAAVLQATMQLQQQQLHARSFRDRRAAWIASHPDFESVVGASEVPLTPVMQQFFETDPDGVAVIDYLARHPEHGPRIAKLGPAQALPALGRLAQLAATPSTTGDVAPSRSVPPRAPAPLTPVGNGAQRSAAPEDLPFGAEYVRRGNEAEQARRRAGVR